jgi:hypothetical protein
MLHVLRRPRPEVAHGRAGARSALSAFQRSSARPAVLSPGPSSLLSLLDVRVEDLSASLSPFDRFATSIELTFPPPRPCSLRRCLPPSIAQPAGRPLNLAMTAASTSVALEPLLSRSRERSPSSPRLEGPGWSPPPSPFAFGSLSPKDQKGRRRALVVLLLLAAAILAGSLFKLDDGALRTLLPQTWSGSVGGPAAHLALKVGQRPGEHFRGRSATSAPAETAFGRLSVSPVLPPSAAPDSLRSDRRYITSFSLAGFNNQARPNGLLLAVHHDRS